MRLNRTALRGLLVAFVLTAPMHATAEPAEETEVVKQPPPRPTWRFKRTDKPVKVVVLAGSIGAYPRNPYGRQIQKLCANVEVKNLSKVGLGSWALKKRFKQQLLDNRRIDFGAEGVEYWLVYGGGLNSVGMPEGTNHHIRKTILMAHRRGMKVVAFALTPWGDDRDRRFRGIKALEYLAATKKVSDFILGRSSPGDALGSYVRRRTGGAEAAWQSWELPDIAIDLYDSPLRDRRAAGRDLADMRKQLERDRVWQRAHAALPADERELRLARDARLAAEAPRWYLRRELRSFDHIHPNEAGHRLIAQVACPSLPPSWGCTCPALDDPASAAD